MNYEYIASVIGPQGKKRLMQEAISDKLVGFFKSAYDKIKGLFSPEFKKKYNWSDSLFIICQMMTKKAGVQKEQLVKSLPRSTKLLKEAYGFEGSIEDIAEEIIDTHEGNPGRAFLILGPPGVGKSEMVYKLADEMGISRDYVKVLNLSQSTRAQYTIPAIFPGTNETTEERYKRFENALKSANISDEDIKLGVEKLKRGGFVPEWTAALLQQDLMAITNATSPGILLLDEIGSADPDLVKFFFEVFLNKKIERFHLPSNWVVVAASNEGGLEDENTFADDAILHNSAMLQRFSIMVLQPSIEEWWKWMEQMGYSKPGNQYYPGYVILKTFFEKNKATFAAHWNVKSNVRGSRGEAESQTGRSSRSWTMFMKYFTGSVIAKIIERATEGKVKPNPEEIQQNPISFFAEYNTPILMKISKAASSNLDKELGSKIGETFLSFKSEHYVTATEIVNNFNKKEVRKKVEYSLTGSDAPTSLETILLQMPNEMTEAKAQGKYFKNVFDFLKMLMDTIQPPPADYVKTLFVKVSGQNPWIQALLEFIFEAGKQMKPPIKPAEQLKLRQALDNPSVETIKDVITKITAILDTTK